MVNVVVKAAVVLLNVVGDGRRGRGVVGRRGVFVGLGVAVVRRGVVSCSVVVGFVTKIETGVVVTKITGSGLDS